VLDRRASARRALKSLRYFRQLAASQDYKLLANLDDHALLEDVARAERGELSTDQCAVLANKLADMAMRHLWRAQELSRTAQKVRPPGWNPPDAPGRE
jgi:hypothetical protein